MKRRTVLWSIVGLILAGLAALAVAASSEMPMVPRAAEGWSRGMVLGSTPVKRSVALCPLADGGMLLTWADMTDRIELARVGSDGRVLDTFTLPVNAAKGRDPQVQVGPDGRLHLLWREEGGGPASVHYLLLEADGTPVAEPLMLSDPSHMVSEPPHLVRDDAGRLHALWADVVGVHWAMLSGAGQMLAGPSLLVPGGYSARVWAGEGGRLHLAWQERRGGNDRLLYYAVFDPARGELEDVTEVASILVSDRMALQDMALGIDGGMGYVFWVTYDRGYERYDFQAVSFPLDQPDQQQVRSLELRAGRGPDTISTAGGGRTPLAVALSENVMSGPQRVDLQVAVVGVEEAQSGEEVVTDSRQASLVPVLAVDDHSYFHLAWLETAGFGRYHVVYASTAPEVMERYNRVNLWDVSNGIFGNLFRLSTLVIALIAVLIMWAVLPFVGLVIYHVLTSEEMLETAGAWVAIGAALVAQIALGFVLPPRIGVEAEWAGLRWMAPAVAPLVAGALLAWWLKRRRDRPLFVAYFLFSGINSLLQMLLYFLL